VRLIFGTLVAEHTIKYTTVRHAREASTIEIAFDFVAIGQLSPEGTTLAVFDLPKSNHVTTECREPNLLTFPIKPQNIRLKLIDKPLINETIKHCGTKKFVQKRFLL